MGYSKRSLMNLEGVHPDLRKVCDRAIELCQDLKLDFIITDGCRTIEEQRVFVATGKSKTMHSRHLGGKAIDYVELIDGRVTYDEGYMSEIADLFKAAADSSGSLSTGEVTGHPLRTRLISNLIKRYIQMWTWPFKISPSGSER